MSVITLIDAATSYEEAKKLVEVGVDFIGVVVALNDNTPGVLNIKEAREVLSAIEGTVKKVVLPFTGIIKDIIVIAQATNPDILHIGTDPNLFFPSDIKSIRKRMPKIKFIKTIPVVNENTIKIAKDYDGIVDYLLLDSKSKKNNKLGGTGETHDWNLSKKIVQYVSVPVILAGGLGPDNVAEAILKVKPFGVDSKTKTDKPGSHEKDLKKVREFIEIVKSIKLD